VSEQVHNGTSAQYAMLYSAIHVGTRWKIRDRRQIKIQTLQKLKRTQKRQTTQNTAEQN